MPDTVLGKIIGEPINAEVYESFIMYMERLVAHPYAYTIKKFIEKYRRDVNAGKTLLSQIAEPTIGEDGRSYVTIESMCPSAFVPCLRNTDLNTVFFFFDRECCPPCRSQGDSNIAGNR